MGRRSPSWESELWSYINNSGLRCPLYNHCSVRLRNDWYCSDDYMNITQLIEGKPFSIEDCSFVGSPPCRVFELVERLAGKHLNLGGIRHPPVPTEIIQLAADKQYPVDIRQTRLKAYHGATWGLNDGWVIQVKEDDPPALKRFTLFHEFFHIITHRNASSAFKKVATGKSAFSELAANSFAAFILMPQEWVEEKWAEVKDLDRMAEIFDVPMPAMAIRLRTLGLTNNMATPSPRCLTTPALC